VYSPEELANAINDNTAMIYTSDLGDKLQKELAVAKDRKVPMLLDDAAGIPPADNAKLYARMGLDLYCFSGGKALCRPMKVGKEEIIGCLTALETWLKLMKRSFMQDGTRAWIAFGSWWRRCL